MEEERWSWICNPYKNKSCKRNACGIMDGRNIRNPHVCFLTLSEECALVPEDLANPEFADKAHRIKKWLDKYYGKEKEANQG